MERPWKHVLLCALILSSTASSNARFAYWSLLPNPTVTSYLSVAPASNSIACVRECMKHSQCDSCAYYRESGTCYLQVETSTTSDGTGNSVEVFKATSPCHVPKMYIAPNTNHVDWKNNGWEMEGNLNCGNDYMYIGDSPTYHCSALGEWTEKQWQCRQKVWRNPEINHRFSVPKTPGPGWAVCMIGTPTHSTRFNLNLAKDKNNVVLHVDVRLHHRSATATIVMASMVDNDWGIEMNKHYTPTPFPVAVNRSFHMAVKTLNLSDVQLFVDGVFIGNFTPLFSLDQVTEVSVSADVDARMLDLWCDQ
ncbi:hypothetical protein V1264_004762 [Littorina saxatilis]|uniref:Galectin n=1 Tax=Littorina saxatilis TaxID=31220 RepID=A0AAN9B249_9CAEN